MNYAEIKYFDIADGPGVRTSLFVSGCRRHCKNCFNACTWSFDYGQPFTEETEQEILDSLDSAFVAGLTVLGGEPFEVENQRALLPFLKKVRSAYPQKEIWVYSGNVLEEMLEGKGGGAAAPHLPAGHARCEVTDEMLSLIDVLVDGPFVEELKNIRLVFRGSENQRVIDLPKTLQAGEVVLRDVSRR